MTLHDVGYPPHRPAIQRLFDPDLVGKLVRLPQCTAEHRPWITVEMSKALAESKRLEFAYWYCRESTVRHAEALRTQNGKLSS